jgi:hypothetical protein
MPSIHFQANGLAHIRTKSGELNAFAPAGKLVEFLTD